jgi:hypothetical protein
MSIRKSIALALMASVGAFGFMPAVERIGELTTRIAPQRRNSSRQYRSEWSYPARDGWSVAHGKRMAKKARNQKRHRSATKWR